jgi:hypothetical protein
MSLPTLIDVVVSCVHHPRAVASHRKDGGLPLKPPLEVEHDCLATQVFLHAGDRKHPHPRTHPSGAIHTCVRTLLAPAE